MNKKLKALLHNFDEFVINYHKDIDRVQLTHEELIELSKFGISLHDAKEEYPNNIDEINKRAFMLRDLGLKYIKKR